MAREYVRRISDELQHKPLDRALLDRFANTVRGRGPVCDIGCGPGHVAHYLKERGIDVVGYDLSPKMVEAARLLNPEIIFQQADMTGLTDADESWTGLVAFYSLIHIPRPEIAHALREFRRILQPGGLLLLAFHIGDEILHLDEWWEQKVNVDFSFSSQRKWGALFKQRDSKSKRSSSVNLIPRSNTKVAALTFLRGDR